MCNIDVNDNTGLSLLIKILKHILRTRRVRTTQDFLSIKLLLRNFLSAPTVFFLQLSPTLQKTWGGGTSQPVASSWPGNRQSMTAEAASGATMLNAVREERISGSPVGTWYLSWSARWRILLRVSGTLTESEPWTDLEPAGPAKPLMRSRLLILKVLVM